MRAAELFADAMFQFPNAQRGQQQRFGASETSGRGDMGFAFGVNRGCFCASA